MGHGADLPSREGELLAGKYRLGRRLGVGGMGEVYRAHNEMIGRDVAIKLLHPEHTRSGDIVARFLREARAANLVRHPNVVDVLDLGQDDKGAPFIVQELLSGDDLGKYLDKSGGKLSLKATLSVMVPVVDAVATAHAKGVVHRDLKPENVFLHQQPDTDGVVPKVLDFGISKIGPQPGDIRVTSTGVSMGTPAYMSPEQVQGMSDLDARTDVWALGVMLQELVSGALPFRATAPGALFLKICTTDPVPLDVVGLGLTADFAQVVARCLRRDRDARYPTAAELARDLRNIAESKSVDATRKLAAVRLDDPPRAVGAAGARDATSETLVDKRTPGSPLRPVADSLSPTTPSSPPGVGTSDAPARQPSPTMNAVVRDTEPRGPGRKRRFGLAAGVSSLALASVVGFLLLRSGPGTTHGGAATPAARGPVTAPAVPSPRSSPETTVNTPIALPAPTAPAEPAPPAATPVPVPAAPATAAPSETDPHNAAHRRGGRTQTSAHAAPASPPPAAHPSSNEHRQNSHAATSYE